MIDLDMIPTAAVNDPEFATTWPPPQYLDLPTPQYTQIFRTSFSSSEYEFADRDYELAKEALERHKLTIQFHLMASRGGCFVDETPLNSTVGEGSGDVSMWSGHRPYRMMYGAQEFMRINLRKFSVAKPGLVYLRTRMLNLLGPFRPFEECMAWEASWLSEVSLGWPEFDERRKYSIHDTFGRRALDVLAEKFWR